MSSNKKLLYIVSWNELDPDDKIYKEYKFLVAESISDLKQDFSNDNYEIREATQAEEIAYVTGYEDGYDVATVEYRLETLNLKDAIPLNMERLTEKFNLED